MKDIIGSATLACHDVDAALSSRQARPLRVSRNGTTIAIFRRCADIPRFRVQRHIAAALSFVSGKRWSFISRPVVNGTWLLGCSATHVVPATILADRRSHDLHCRSWSRAVYRLPHPVKGGAFLGRYRVATAPPFVSGRRFVIPWSRRGKNAIGRGDVVGHRVVRCCRCHPFGSIPFGLAAVSPLSRRSGGTPISPGCGHREMRGPGGFVPFTCCHVVFFPIGLEISIVVLSASREKRHRVGDCSSASIHR